jgi:N-acetylglucosaminyldiphosphoundecaprenol N-acetyl-beta-D-mannosaminyltransferase
MSFSISSLILFDKSLEEIPDVKLLINTINAHSYNTAQGDSLFSEAILNSDILLPDGVGIVFAAKLIKGKSLKKIAGADLFFY